MPDHLYHFIFLIIIITSRHPSSSLPTSPLFQLCAQAQVNGTFGGRLTSLTWQVRSGDDSSQPTTSYLLIMLNQTGYQVWEGDIGRTSMALQPFYSAVGIDRKYLKHFAEAISSPESITTSKNDTSPKSLKSKRQLIGYSTLEMRPAGWKRPVRLVYFQTAELVLRVISTGTGPFDNEQAKKWATAGSFALVHDNQPSTAQPPYAFGIDGGGTGGDDGGDDHDQQQQQPFHFRFFPVEISRSVSSIGDSSEAVLPVELWQRDHGSVVVGASYWPTLAGGYLHLLPVTRYGTPPLGNGRTFSSLPRGTVLSRTGVLYLLDDALGCVYSVEGWHRLDLLESRATGGDRSVMRFRATGTPYERFFTCRQFYLRPNESLPRCSKDPRRCDISAGGRPFLVSLLLGLLDRWVLGCVFLGLALLVAWYEVRWWRRGGRDKESGGSGSGSASKKKRRGKGKGFLVPVSIAAAVSADDRLKKITSSASSSPASNTDVIASISPFKQVKDFRNAVARMASKASNKAAKTQQSSSRIARAKSKMGSRAKSKQGPPPPPSAALPPDTGDRLRRLLNI